MGFYGVDQNDQASSGIARWGEWLERATSRLATHIIIYSTGPVHAVVGVAEVERVQQASPSRLWKLFGAVGGIGRNEFFKYYSDRATGVAYILDRVWSCKAPFPLGAAGLPQSAPQAYQYVSSEVLESVLARAVLSPSSDVTRFAASA